MRLFVALTAVVLLMAMSVAYADKTAEDGLIPEWNGANLPYPEGGASETFTHTEGGYSWWYGIYDYDLNLAGKAWVNEKGTGGTAGDIDVKCDIELYCYDEIWNPKIYFHIADENVPPPAVVHGSLRSNNGEWIGIEVPETKNLLDLVGTTDGFGRDISDQTIGLLWELQEVAANGTVIRDWRPADTVGEGASGTIYAMWWLIAYGEPCTHYYNFRCTIKPEVHQPDGHYVLDPVVTVKPAL